MNRKCCGGENFQPWPDRGKLAAQQNLTFEELKKKLGNDYGTVHGYVVSTVKRLENARACS